MARFRFVVGGAIIAAGIGFLVVTAFHQSATRRTTLAELVAAPAPRASSLERLQLGGGTVAPGSILWDEFRSRPEFTIRDGQHALRVRYVGHGVLPDTFRDSAQVVLEGRYDAGAGVFLADVIYAKCPSKYAGQSYADHVRAHASD